MTSTHCAPLNYQNLVAIRSADKGKPWVRDLEAAYRSREFLAGTNFPDFAKPDFQQAPPSAK
ncbi:MAG TPA: hypothetical protein VGP06_06560 [Janthinobacterium sp.]|jgi:D-methionine transport system substrate-binding protein|nr:hypothetical protein [Janthinobacterium sp.]